MPDSHVLILIIILKYFNWIRRISLIKTVSRFRQLFLKDTYMLTSIIADFWENYKSG